MCIYAYMPHTNTHTHSVYLEKITIEWLTETVLGLAKLNQLWHNVEAAKIHDIHDNVYIVLVQLQNV